MPSLKILKASCLVCVAGFIFPSQFASAREIHVSPSHPLASNHGKATLDQPLRSLRVAALRAKPGDTVWVNGGTYRESIVTGAGQPGRPISIKSMPGTRPFITGLDVVGGPWKAEGNGIFSIRWGNPTQIVVANGKPLAQVGMFFHGTPPAWKPPATLRRGDEGSLKPGKFHFSQKAKRLFVRLPGDSDPSQAVVEASSRSIGIQLRSHTRLEGIDVAFFQGRPDGGGNGIVAAGKDIEVTNCRSKYNDFSGIYPQGTDITIRECESSWNGNNGFTSSYGFNIRILDSRTSNNNTRGYDMAWHGGGLKFVQQRNLLIDHHHTQEETIGLWLDINCTDAQVSNSTMKDCEVGLFYEISRWGVLVNNVFEDCERGLWSYSSDVLIAHNAFLRCRQSVVVQGEPRMAEYRMGHGTEPGIQQETLAAVRNNYILNNVIASPSPTELTIWPDSPSSSGHYCDHNVYAIEPPTGGNLADFRFCSTWGVRVPLEAWKQRGFDTNSLFCWAGGQLAGGNEPPAILRSDSTFDFSPDSHPARSAGRQLASSLSRGPSSEGRPWSLVRGSKRKDRNPVEVGGLFFKSWQNLPPARRLVAWDDSPVSPGPLAGWRKPGACPRFDSATTP